ncbi:PREDICTED: uncharacterized protein LOC104704191 [Camelina sativa]|uniref:Uncharacterized protein LOC104704191 n=1 Tax=Camelina sativa TaxID=90675 RepID=A0ABM0SZZ8_CAMSA|nr:PREDICTED: uncharacterized protein LOC104704191 [Camelina sativa]
MDQALMAMSLEEEDIPFTLPDLPEFSSCERNYLSLIGRILNPKCQSVSGVVFDMPRKWQKGDRIRGIALSKERFQFIFQNEHDLEDVLNKGFQTYNDWGLIMERWTEHPAADSLQFTTLWVQIRNIPINHYTAPAITAIGELAGQVLHVAFDPSRAQGKEYVRVQIRFDVSKPLRKSKVIGLPNNKSVEIFFNYEKVQKRCFKCQRLSHEVDFCPILIKNREDTVLARRMGLATPKANSLSILKEADPLFSVLREDQVGINPLSGRPRIAPEVLEGMRQYLLSANGEVRSVKEDRVRKTVGEAEKSPFTHKSTLSLEPIPIISHNVDIGKGRTFGYDSAEYSSKTMLIHEDESPTEVSAHRIVGFSGRNAYSVSDSIDYYNQDATGVSVPFLASSSVNRIGFSETSPSGSSQKKQKPRKRQQKRARLLKGKDLSKSIGEGVKSIGLTIGKVEKRKAREDLDGEPSAVKAKSLMGLGRPQDLTIPRLMELRKKHFPEVMFLMETMNCKDVIVDIQVWLGYENVYTVDPVGTCGGLALFWKKSVDISVYYEDKNLLDLAVQFGEYSFFLTCVYGNTNFCYRHQVWERLTRFGLSRKGNWCMIGDFNEILNNEEKLGGPRRSDNSFLPFSTMLKDCGMSELPSSGNGFTWGGRRGTHWIQSKLDRCFANKDWVSCFPAANQAFLPKRGSDHRPILVSLVSSQDLYRGSFRFDKRLLHKPGVKEAISMVWRQSAISAPAPVSQRIRDCRRVLSKWKKENEMNSKVKIIAIQNELELVQSSSDPSASRLRSLKNKLVEANKEEESHWQQKSRDKWMLEGDRNTKFFHASVKNLRSKNGLDKLQDPNGIVHRSEASKGEVAASYFQNLFSTSSPVDIQAMLEGVTPRVTDVMNQSLLAKVSKEEVKNAVFSINPSKAPGADGMTGMFFQQYWDIVGHQVTSEVLAFFDSGIFPKEWNFTQLCLIPKKVNSSLMSDLRPISLCSVLYKVVAKIIMSRLQPLLSEIVSPNQSAFIPERLISDNILIAHEAIHGLRTDKVIAKEFMAVKTDMSKAYDRMEWSYLEALMLGLGFHQRWVQLVMFCVTSVTYTVLINGQPFGIINPQRGLRQGDPLSPALFVLCAEGLTHLLNKAESEGKIYGIQFSTEGPAIHHLLFADDSLFMIKASEDQGCALQKILSDYGEVTGQLINLEKSSITFGAQVEQSLKTMIATRLGIFKEGGAGTYLGLPECFSGSKVEMLSYIHDRMKGRMSGWFARTLSQGGKEILLKSVAMAMPVFAMTCFKLPKKTCENLSSAMSAFWWDSTENKKKMHWISWEKLCLPKHAGGLGFKDIQIFNQALLSKQAWRVLQDKDCLFARFFKSRYFPDSDFLSATLGYRPSYAWRSILHGRDLLKRGLRQMIGDGASTFVWSSRWVLDGIMRAPLMKNILFDLDLMVKDLLDTTTQSWDLAKLQYHFYPRDVELILKIKPVMSSEDYLIWEHTKSGAYSVKSGYWAAYQREKIDLLTEALMQPSVLPIKNQIWKISTATKIRNFLWKVVSGAIPVADKMLSRGMKVDSRCQSCGLEGESVNHVLFSCTVARQVWAMFNFPVPCNGFDSESVFQNIYYLLLVSKNSKYPVEVRTAFPWVVWQLWKNRNLFSFEGRSFCASRTVAKIRDNASQWFHAQSLTVADAIVERSKADLGKKGWYPPVQGWKKCNLGSSWDKETSTGGAAWVLRNEKGETLMHSRRSFASVFSKMDASLLCWLWAIESMKSLNFDKIVFASEDSALMGAVQRPPAWPSFKFQSRSIGNALGSFLQWKLWLEERSSNLVAHLIAKSVTREDRRQSYRALQDGNSCTFWYAG